MRKCLLLSEAAKKSIIKKNDIIHLFYEYGK
nr:MAG TPA: hypothetical protein [Caudoviricetes sp.]